jgi:hypothetical protein
MNTINFAVGKNYYHTIKESNETSDGITIKGDAIITGYSKEPLEGGGYSL